MLMPSLGQFLDSGASRIAEAFLEDAGRLPSARSLSREELLSGFFDYLAQLSGPSFAISAVDEDALASRPVEVAHLRMRMRLGYTEEDVTEEYAALGRAITALWQDLPEHQRPPAAEVDRLFSELGVATRIARLLFTGESSQDRQRERHTLRRLDALSWQCLVESPTGPRVEPLLELVREAMGVDGVMLLRLHGAGAEAELRFAGSAGWELPSDFQFSVVPDSPSYVGRVARAEGALPLADASRENGDTLPAPLLQGGARTLLGVRLWPHGRLMGVLLAVTREPTVFDPQACRWFETLADHLANVLARAAYLRQQRENELRYRLALTATSDVVWDLDPRTGFVVWGEGLDGLSGYTPLAFGDTLEDWAGHIHPEDRPRVMEGIRRAMDSDAHRWRDEYRLLHRDGHYVLVVDHALISRDAAGRVTRMVGAMRDVTEERRAEAALRISEERHRLAVDAARLGTWEYLPASRTLLCDRRCKEMFGHPPDEPASVESLLSSVHPEDRRLVKEALRRTEHPDEAEHLAFEFRILRGDDGSLRWIRATGRAYRSIEGGEVRFIGTVRDRTELRTAQEAIVRSEESYRTLAESMPQVVWTASPAGRIDYVNSRLTGYLGCTRDEALTLTWKNICHPEDLPRTMELIHASVRTGTAFELEHRLRRKDGVFRWFLTRCAPQTDPSGRVLRWFGTSTDVEDLKTALAELNRRVVFEQQLIGIVSHDLRNPVTAIVAGCEAMQRREDLSAPQRARLTRVQDSAARMGRMIVDLLDFTEARLRGGLAIVRRPGDLHELVGQVLEEMRLAHPRREVRLQTSGDGRGEWDLDRLAQVVQNLVANALAYGHRASPVTVDSRGTNDQVEIAVHNEGDPIPAHLLAQIFKPLERGSARNHRSRSLGLGLFIVSEVVKAHGGELTVQSENAGTVFRVRLPRSPPPRSP